MPGKSYQILSINEAKARLDDLCDRVAQMNVRVILTRKGTDADCVLISAAELEGLERAIEILSETNAVTMLREQVARIATAASSSTIAPTH